MWMAASVTVSEIPGSKCYDELLALCRRRRSVRRFRAEPVPEEMIGQILDLARTSPYASGKRNWTVRVIREEATRQAMAGVVRARVEEILPSVREDFRQEFRQYACNFSVFSAAPVLLIPVFRVSPALSLLLPAADAALSTWEREAFTKSIACVAMLVLLAAESLGLGACLMTGPLIAHDGLRRLLDIPAGREIGAVIPVGFHHQE